MQRAGFWLAIAGMAMALVALPIAVIALNRTGHSQGGMDAMSGMPSMGGAMEKHMAAVPAGGVPAARKAVGGRPLKPQMRNGIATFDLTAMPVRWSILPGVRVVAWTYNGMTPGPELRVRYGQRVRITVKNDLPEPTSVHWHGIAVPNAMDGVPGVTQKPIEPGKRFTYEFRAIPAGGNSKGGTFFYHSHFDEDRQVGLGLAGALIIEPPRATRYDVERTLMIQEWNLTNGETRPAMDIEGMLPNYFTLNGKSFPATGRIKMRVGERALLRLVGAGQFTHPMHLHGTDFGVVAVDGHPVAGPPPRQDTVLIGSGQRYDLAFTFASPGRWVFHCHIGHHLTNDGESPGGLMTVFDVT